VVPDVAEELRLVDAARHRLRHLLGGWLAREQVGLDALRSRPVLGDPRGLLEERAAEVDELRDRGRRTLGHRLERAADDIAHHRARARALSPLATLERGYAVLQDADGHVVTSVARVQPKAKISVRVADGRVHATTTRTEPLEGADG
jgi:exodeoxyribonuclease VII large subunit